MMFDPKVFMVLALVVVLAYGILVVLHQFDWFRKYEDVGASFAFEAVLGMVALVMGFIGLWINGYEKGFEDGKAEGNKT